MKKGILWLAFGFLILPLHAQSSLFTGTWDIIEDSNHPSFPEYRISVVSSSDVRILKSSGGVYSPLAESLPGCTVKQQHSFLTTQLLVSGTIDCPQEKAVTTLSFHLFSFGNAYSFYGLRSKIVTTRNNFDMSAGCFSEGGCSIISGEVFVRAQSQRIILEENISVGASTAPLFKVESVRFSPKAIEVVLFIVNNENSYTGTLHEPGADFAFFLRDNAGKEYKLVYSLGWSTDYSDGYGSRTLEPNEEEHIVLFFEPASNPLQIKSLNLIEGACESNCWNFYDIRLKDN